MTYLLVMNRITAALVGGYAFIWGFTAFAIAGLVALGVDFHQAETGILMLAFLVFLVAFLWTFAARSMLKVWAVLGLGALVLIGTALGLQQQLLGKVNTYVRQFSCSNGVGPHLVWVGSGFCVDDLFFLRRFVGV